MSKQHDVPLIERVVLLTAESLVRWSVFRPERADVARAGLNDIGRILWIVRFYEIDTVDALLAAERRRFLSLDAFGAALRAMASDTEFALSDCGYASPMSTEAIR